MSFEEWPPIEDQILRLYVRPDHGQGHFLLLREEEETLWENYQQVGSETRISLSHVFDTIYGVSSVAGMDPQTAIRVGQELVKWGERHIDGDTVSRRRS